MNPKIIAYTGAQGVGKTTSAYQTAAMVKIENPDKTVGVLVDVEAGCPYPINRECPEAALQWIFFTRLAMELEMAVRYDLIITDRTVMDTVAYTFHAGYRVLAEEMRYIARRHMDIYQSIRFLKTSSFAYNFKDGIRDTNEEFRMEVEDILLSFYQMAGITEQERFTEI